MTFSTEWEHIYSSGEHLSIWPWTDLVSFVMRYARPTGPDFRVLEIGVGAGANVPFFHHSKTQYYAVDGSATAIARLRDRFPDTAENFQVADFTVELPVPGHFDLIVDRGSLTSNTDAAIRRCLGLVFDRLKPGGKMISIDFFSDQHSDFPLGRMGEDKFTRTDITDGHLAGLGNIHFADEAHIRSLFALFDILVLEHKTIDALAPAAPHRFATFSLVCQKQV